MYPTSNQSQPSRDPNGINASTPDGSAAATEGIGLARYRSAPVSFLTTTVDSVINGQPSGQQHPLRHHILTAGGGGGGGGTPSRFFSPPDATNSQLSSSTSTGDRSQTTSFRLNEFATAFNGLKSTTQIPSPLFRHGSSPAGFLNTLASSTPTDGISGSRLGSQLSFTGSGSFSQISQERDIGNSLVFDSSSSSHNKRAKQIDINGLNIMDSELNFGLSESALEAATIDKMMDIPHDSVPCKIRAKRGCATHPRSIAERERRTRISGKLKKLQDLVPNMDKQTSYSDMLDLAVQHIKGLQTQVQTLHKELENCSCGCKPN